MIAAYDQNQRCDAIRPDKCCSYDRFRIGRIPSRMIPSGGLAVALSIAEAAASARAESMMVAGALRVVNS